MTDRTLLSSNSIAERLLAQARTPLLANAYALLFSNAAASGLGFIYWALAARFYPAEVVGVNSAAVAALLFLTGIGGLYLDGALVRFIPRAGHRARRLILGAYLVSACMALLAGVTFLLGLDFWAPDLGFLRAGPGWFALFVAATIASTLFLLQDGALTGLRYTVWVPVENSAYALLKIGLLLLFASRIPESGIFLSWTIPLVVMLLPVNWLIFRHLLPRHIQQNEGLALPLERGQIVHYSGGLYVGFLFSLAASKLLPVIVLGYVGSAASAYFYLPWMIASALQLITPSMTTSLTVEGARDPSQLAAYSRRIMIQAAGIVVPASLAVFAGAPLLLRLFGADYAANGTLLMRLLALATIPHVVTGLYLGVSRVQRRVGQVVAVQATILVLLLGLSHLLLPSLGIAGVGWAWLASQSVMAAVLGLTRVRKMLSRSADPDRAARPADPLIQERLTPFPHRIHIVGGPGSGKTTLARELGTLLDIPVYELDEVAFVGPDFDDRPPGERQARVEAIAQRKEWITEGIFVSWTDHLVEEADIVIWLDHITWVQAIRRIVHRFAQLAWHDACRQRRIREFFRFRDYARHFSQLIEVFFSSRRYYQGTGADEDRQLTVRRLEEYHDKVIHCRTPDSVRMLRAYACGSASSKES